VLTGRQSKMARAALDWSAEDLARAADISVATLKKFEKGGTIRPNLARAIERALLAQGMRFVIEGEHVGAVIPPSHT
jgi:DNA-binding XRE family transcriptional regulator